MYAYWFKPNLVGNPEVRFSLEGAHTAVILNFWTDRSGQTVQTQIRLLLEEQSDQGFHCSLFHLHLFDVIPKGLTSFLEF